MSRRQVVRAFTLVELLVVIGIIALLISILLPTLSKARDTANRTACLSNMRQLGTAFVMYTNENKGFFPYNTSFARSGSRLSGGGPGGYPSAYGKDRVVNNDFVDPGSGSGSDYGPHPEDWIYWQVKYAPKYRDISESAIGKYLGGNGNQEAIMKILRCPSDSEVLNRQPHPSSASGEGGYTFSYTLNAEMSLRKIATVRRSAEKILLVEEHNANDGRWAPGIPSGGPSADPLTTRHGSAPLPSGYDPNGGQVNKRIGINVPAAFCDGHGELIDQVVANDIRRWAWDK